MSSKVLLLPGFDANESNPDWDPESSPIVTLPLGGVSARMEILARLKSGKEATVYVCEARSADGRRILAAKFYRPRSTRGFKNDAIYREGRAYRGRQARAVAARSGFGVELGFAEWVVREYEALKVLHARGADVPEPLALGGNYLVEDFVGDDMEPSPMLFRVRLGLESARALFDQVMRNVRIILSCDLVHADLSAHNILFWRNQARLIDFPQAVDARSNPNAFDLLVRDLSNVCAYFRRFGVDESGPLLAAELWDRYQRGRL